MDVVPAGAGPEIVPEADPEAVPEADPEAGPEADPEADPEEPPIGVVEGAVAILEIPPAPLLPSITLCGASFETRGGLPLLAIPMQQPPIPYRQAAAMSERVYYPPRQRGKYYASPEAVWPWTIPTNMSSRDWCVWVSRGGVSSPRAVLAFRGTSLQGLGDIAKLRLTSTGYVKTASDLVADGEILAGRFREGQRFRDSLAVAKRVVAAYGADNTVITGHSLGGRIAIECALDTGAWGIAFAPGYSPFDPTRSARGPRIRSFTARNDIVAVAALADGGAEAVEGASGHGIDQYNSLFTRVGSSFSQYRFEV